MILARIDSALNSITMYRLVLYGLMAISSVAVAFGFVGWLPFPGLAMVSSLFALIASVNVFNILFAKVFKAPTNIESASITGLILFLILYPAQTRDEWLTLFLAAALAMISKYVMAVQKKHIFNPVAISLVILTLLGNPNAFWWVGSLVLQPIVLVTGLLVVRKVRKFGMLAVFLITAVVMFSIFGLINQVELPDLYRQILASWPLFFFGTFMLTEPLTTPPTKKLQLMYGGLIGLLFGSQYHIGPIFSTPELALVVGNVFSYAVSPKGKYVLELRKKMEIARQTYEFVFAGNKHLQFQPGEYMEWTMPMKKADSRGNRRYFTIASSPTEKDVRLGIRFSDGASEFKQAMLGLKPGDTLMAGNLAGEFVLPENIHEKLVMIAGGIGVTPFRSMAQYSVDKGVKRDVVLFYINSYEDEIAYQDVFEKASKVGWNTVYVLTRKEDLSKNWQGEVGYLTQETIKQHVPDISERTFYLSGPNKMVKNYEKLLKKMGIARNKIKKDYFPGF